MGKNDFYVYIYLDPRKPGEYIYDDLKFDYEPFYVGKGSGDRIKSSLRIRYGSKFKEDKLKFFKKLKIEPLSLKLHDNIEEKTAFNLEVDTIKKIGRKDLNKGPLTNVTDGGEGSSGLIITSQMIEKIKNKMSIKYKIKTPNNEIIEFRGTNQVNEYFEKLNKEKCLTSRFKISPDAILYKNGSKGYFLIEKLNDYRNMNCGIETRNKMSKNNTKEKNMNSVLYKIKLPNDEIIEFIGREEMKLYFKNTKISYESIINNGFNKNYILIEKIKINKKRVD